jgi:uncharacterized protein DUF4403
MRNWLTPSRTCPRLGALSRSYGPFGFSVRNFPETRSSRLQLYFGPTRRRGFVRLQTLPLLILVLTSVSFGRDYNIPPHVVHVPPVETRPPTGESYLAANVSIDLAQVNAIAAAQFPHHLEWETPDYKTYFDLESGPRTYVYPATANDPQHIGIIATYTGEFETKSFAFGCHLKYLHPVPYIQIVPGIQSVGDTWNIGAAHVEAEIGLRSDSDTQCGTCPFCTDISAQVNRYLNGAPQFKAIVQALTDLIQIREHYIQGWLDFSSPVALSTGSANEQACIYPDIKRIYSEPVEQNGNYGEFVVGLFMNNPITLIAPGPNCAAGVAESISLSADKRDMADGLNVHAAIPMLYNETSARIETQLKAIPNLQLESKPFHITSVSVTDATGRFFIGIDVQGKINGRAYFWGTPALNAAKSAIVFPDLRLADESRKAIESQKRGLANSFINALQDDVIQASETDISDRVAKITKALDGIHTGQKVSFNVQLQGIEPESVYSSLGALFVNVHVTGSADLSIVQYTNGSKVGAH